MNDNFMKEKPAGPLLASMALPMVLSMLVNSLYNIVDSFFVARISEQAMTALSLVYPVQNLINAIAIGFGVGINSQISFYLGCKEYGECKQGDYPRHALRDHTWCDHNDPVVSRLCLHFLGMFTADRTVVSLGTQYSTIAFSFSVVIMISLSFEKIFQAVGKNEDYHDQSSGGMYFQYYPGSPADLRNRFFPENGNPGCSTCHRAGTGIYRTGLSGCIQEMSHPGEIQLEIL